MNEMCIRLLLLSAILTVVSTLRIAVVGEGVIGLSTATAILDLAEKENMSTPDIHVYHHKPFERILSRHIAGLFRVDSGSKINKKYGYDTFEKLATLWREYGGLSGVQLVSGHILSDSQEKLNSQRESYGDLVYNYRDLTDVELYGKTSLFNLPRNTTTRGIHYTAYTSEGLRFCPFLKKELIAKGVRFTQRKIKDLAELGGDHDVVVNAAGLYGGVLAGDDAGNMTPIRGVLIRVDAPWQKHFLYRDFDTITIPVFCTANSQNNSALPNPTIRIIVYTTYLTQIIEFIEKNYELMESWESKSDISPDSQVMLHLTRVVHEVSRHIYGAYGPNNVTFHDIQDITSRYIKLQPSFKRVHMLSSFVGYRPGRKQVRVEKQLRSGSGGKTFTVVHNYGHGGNGFTLAYGTALHAARLVLDLSLAEYDGIVPTSLPINATIGEWVDVLDNE